MSGYLGDVPQLPADLQLKLAAIETASLQDADESEHEPTPAEKVKINAQVRQIRQARERHERFTGELVRVERPLRPGEQPNPDEEE